ncbi:MAG: tetratricopeptide repeat protein [Kouleothrix sp.]
MHHESLAVFRERLGEKSVGVLWAYWGLGEAALGQGDAPAATAGCAPRFSWAVSWARRL